jgi:hypothetical protein
MTKKSLIIFSALILISFWASAHKFYTSLTQVEFNSKTRSAEIIMNVFTDDLEVSVSNHFNRKIKSSDKDFPELCYQYLDTKFYIKDIKNHLLKNEYVGLEFKRDMVSIYFEIKLPLGLNNLHLKQITLLETYNEQTNIVNLRNGKTKTSLVFRAGTPNVQTVNLGS